MLTPIRDLDQPVFSHHTLVLVKLLLIPNVLLAKLEHKLNELELLSLNLVAYEADTSLAILVYAPELAENITSFIHGNEIREMKSPETVTAVSPKQAYTKIEAELQTVDSQIKLEWKHLMDTGTPRLAHLAAAHDLLSINIHAFSALPFVGYDIGASNHHQLTPEKKNVLLKLIDKDETVIHGLKDTEHLLLDGWLDPDDEAAFTSQIAHISKNIEVTTLDASTDPEQRTVMKNNPLLQPFEMITSLLGTPHPSETDPSPYVAPFFIIFFGFALGDAGYGLLLAAIALYFMKKFKRNKRAMSPLLLVLYCSISTFIFGALTGSWFGADLQAIGSVGRVLDQVKFLDLQSNLILVLMASLFIGFIHQLFGLILGARNYVKNNDVVGAFADPGSWIFLLLSIIFFAFSSMNIVPDTYAGLARPLLWISLIFFAFGQGRGAKNIFLRPLIGLGKLFNITGYISNTLSYARLLALALATNVIGSVVNLLAVMVAGVAWIGPLLAVAVFIGGHVFNIVLNVMGTFINVARLHLVEFFPRFFTARGIALEPLHPQLTFSSFAEDFDADHINLITRK
jgi:hypothetical protein